MHDSQSAPSTISGSPATQQCAPAEVRSVRTFSRELLPPATVVYSTHLRKLGRPNRQGWALALCPFHDDHRPSLSVNMQCGGFFCFSCLAKGGDVIDFLMLRYGWDFVRAVTHLGAWRTCTAAKKPIVVNDEKVHFERKEQYLETRSKDLRFFTLTKLWFFEELQSLAARRLAELQRGAAERWKRESELCGWVLADVCPRIRRAIAAYTILSFGSTADRERFVAFPEHRKAMIEEVLDVCYVRDDQGRYMAVAL